MRHERVLAGCVGKIPYPTKGAALQRVNGQMKRKRGKINDGGWARRSMTIYRCPNCHNWHVGGSIEAVKAMRTSAADHLENSVLSMIPDAVLAKVIGR